MKNKAIIAIGTNSNQRDNAEYVREMLSAMFGENIRFSPFLKTKPLDGSKGYYINALAELYTRMPLARLKMCFKQMETDCGRNQEDTGAGYVPIDIDILQYGDRRFKTDDWQRDYVQALMKVLNPDAFDAVEHDKSQKA